MYTQIEGMLTAEEAADDLVFHANNIAATIKRNDNAAFEYRVVSMNALLNLLRQYTEQES